MIVSERKIFEVPDFPLQCGKKILARAGYETYGTLNENKDNAILVSHYFSSTGHAAGKYTEEDAAAGYWDGLIGPGKAVDTDKYPGEQSARTDDGTCKRGSCHRKTLWNAFPGSGFDRYCRFPEIAGRKPGNQKAVCRDGPVTGRNGDHAAGIKTS